MSKSNYKIAVVLYCYTINDWKEKFENQILRIESSGLYEAADCIKVIIADVENNKDYVLSITDKYSKIDLDYYTINYGSEYLGIKFVDDLARTGDYKILYFHTKGVFNKFKNFISKEIDHLKVKAVDSWVEKMHYFLLDNFKTCIEELNNKDVVGVTNISNWWWGNFWWATSDHIRKNIPFVKFYSGTRWSCEAWLFDSNTDKENIKYLELYHFEYDPHYSYIPKYFYDGSDISNIEINIIDAFYGFFYQQRDEGRGPSAEEDKIINVTEKIKDLLKEYENKRIVAYPGHDYLGVEDPLPHNRDKCLRIKFSTNIDPEKEYIVSSIGSFKIDIGYKN